MTIHQQIKESKNVIYQDREILIVLDHDPISIGHVLILPQKQFLDIDEIPEDVLNKLFKAAQLYVKLIKKEYTPKGYSIMQNGGAFNDIDVFHLHVFPRFDEKEFGYMKVDRTGAADIEKLRRMMQEEIGKIELNSLQ